MNDNQPDGGTFMQASALLEGAEGAISYASIFDSCFDAIDFKSPDGIFTAWNPAAERLYGFTADEMIGKHVSSLYTPEDYAGFARRFDLAKEERCPCHFESVRLTREGLPITVFVALSPVVDASGRLLGVSAISRDLTREKMLIEETRRLARDREELLSIMGNDVLNTINQFHRIVTTLDAGGKEPEIRVPRSIFEALLRNNGEFGRSIENLLMVYSLVPGGSLAFRAVRILELLERQAVRSGNTDGAANVSICQELDGEDDLIVQAEEKLLRRLFSNLIDWSVSRCQVDSPLTLSVISSKTCSNVEVKVEFIGKCYDEAEIDSLFSSRWREVNGAETGSVSGLGLFLARWTAEVHGGSLRFSSDRGRNCFEVVLPKSQSQATKPIELSR